MKNVLRSFLLLLVIVGLSAVCARGHEAAPLGGIVIDTDMGLDDVVALAMALQYPDFELQAIIACAGAMSGEAATTFVERMLHRFNRSDVVLYAPADSGKGRTPAESSSSCWDR